MCGLTSKNVVPLYFVRVYVFERACVSAVCLWVACVRVCQLCVCGLPVTNKRWRRPIECLFFIRHFPQKSPMISGSFAKNVVTSRNIVSLPVTDTRWRKPIECFIFIGHFPQKSPMISGSFAKNDLRFRASYRTSPPCTRFTLCQSPWRNLALICELGNCCCYIYIYVYIYIYMNICIYIYWYIYIIYICIHICTHTYLM